MLAALHAPMQECTPPTQQENCANLIIAIFPLLGKGGMKGFLSCVVASMRCREISLHRFLFALTDEPGERVFPLPGEPLR